MGIGYLSRKTSDSIAKNGPVISYVSTALGGLFLGMGHADGIIDNNIELIVLTALAGPVTAVVSGAVGDYQTHRLNVETNFPPDKRLSAKKCVVCPAVSTAIGAVMYAVGYCSSIS